MKVIRASVMPFMYSFVFSWLYRTPVKITVLQNKYTFLPIKVLKCVKLAQNHLKSRTAEVRWTHTTSFQSYRPYSNTGGVHVVMALDINNMWVALRHLATVDLTLTRSFTDLYATTG